MTLVLPADKTSSEHLAHGVPTLWNPIKTSNLAERVAHTRMKKARVGVHDDEASERITFWQKNGLYGVNRQLSVDETAIAANDSVRIESQVELTNEVVRLPLHNGRQNFFKIVALDRLNPQQCCSGKLGGHDVTIQCHGIEGGTEHCIFAVWIRRQFVPNCSFQKLQQPEICVRDFLGAIGVETGTESRRVHALTTRRRRDAPWIKPPVPPIRWPPNQTPSKY